jgi:hypothetical protein
MKKKILFYIILLMIVAGVYFVDMKKSFGVFLKDDFRLAVMAGNGIGLISISPNRGMVNYLEISGDTYVWLPGGYGWYASKNVARLLDQEKKRNMADDILFYNFGFETKTILWIDSVSNWDQWSNLSSGLGLIPSTFARWRFNNMFFKQDYIKDNLINNLEIDEILRREFSGNVLVEEGIRLSIYNDSDLDNLAAWVADRLSWAGLPVLSVGDWQGEEIDNCKVFYKESLTKSWTLQFLKDRFDKCEYVPSNEVSDDEIEIVLGRSWAEMIDYNSYVRTF